MPFRFLNRYRSLTNGGAGPPSRPIARGPNTREAELQRELDALYAERATLARAEAAERANLLRLQDRLDILAGEIDALARRTRDPALRENGAAMISRVKAAAQTNGAGRNTQTIVDTIKYALGIGPSPWAGPTPPTAPPAQPAAVRADPQSIIDAGAKVRGEQSVDIRTGQPRPLPSPLATLDPAAAAIVRAGRRARNELADE